MVVFDTDCVIGLLRENPAAAAKMRALRDQGERLCITSLTAFELLHGAMLSTEPDEERRRIFNVIESFFVIDFGYLDADAAARILCELDRKGTPIGTIDVLIAGICIAAREALVTRNARHFQRIPDLKVEKW